MPQQIPEQWSAWILTSDAALRVGRTVRGLAAAGMIVALAIVVDGIFTPRPVHHPAWFLLPGIPVLVAGQLWTIAVLTARRDPADRVSRAPRFRRGMSTFFDGLPGWQATLLTALCVAAWLVAMTGILDHSGPPPQRFVAGIFVVFFTVHTGAISAEIARRRAGQLANAYGYAPRQAPTSPTAPFSAESRPDPRALWIAGALFAGVAFTVVFGAPVAVVGLLLMGWGAVCLYLGLYATSGDRLADGFLQTFVRLVFVLFALGWIAFSAWLVVKGL